MTANDFMQSLMAFNQNAVNNIVYNLSTNWWLIFLVIGAIATAVMGVTEQSTGVVYDEQNIL